MTPEQEQSERLAYLAGVRAGQAHQTFTTRPTNPTERTNTMTIDVEATATLLADLEHQREQIDAQIDACKTLLLDAVEAGATITIGDQPIYKVQRGNLRFNEAKATAAVDPETLAKATQTVQKVDPRLLRDLVPPTVWEACCERGRPYLRGL